ncbi:Uncharacterised protein [uncultured archaeon]|nr:Uncharacterised protein [uncultured archaeon]
MRYEIQGVGMEELEMVLASAENKFNSVEYKGKSKTVILESDEQMNLSKLSEKGLIVKILPVF